MGACDISFELDGSKTREDVKAAFLKQKDEDADTNGHQSGYSGDFQTVNRVDFHDDKVFKSETEAAEYCFKHAVKWETVVAVKYEVREPIKADAKLKRLDAKLKLTYTAMGELKSKVTATTQALIKSKPFYTCRNCKSRLNTAHVNGVDCRVCGSSLIPAKDAKRLSTLINKHTELSKAYAEHKTALKAKAKVKGTMWLVCGWGAC